MSNRRAVNLAILVAALGYFVDIYDLILFSVVRVDSLHGIGIVGETAVLNAGVLLLNRQMWGMLIGGVIWGILGDVRGRLSVLFGSILLYSVANLANSMVTSLGAYEVLRFMAGVGLAGELGAGITLVSELMRKESRGYGTSIVAAIGILGAIVAELVSEAFDWRMAYVVGGVLGLLLLILRISVRESPMFQMAKTTSARRGNFFMLFHPRDRLIRYVSVILVGVPIWYVIGILVTFSPEFAKEMGLPFVPSAGRAILWLYAGLVVGDLASGFLSQYLKSRRRAMAIFLGFTVLACLAYFLEVSRSLTSFYALCVGMGFATGYWAVFVTMSAEQFGTNLRATAATTTPNFVRGAMVPMTALFQMGREAFGMVGSGIALGLLVLGLAVASLAGLQETFGKDLDYLEE